MKISPKVRMNRLFRNGGCLDVAVDHGVCNEPTLSERAGGHAAAWWTCWSMPARMRSR